MPRSLFPAAGLLFLASATQLWGGETAEAMLARYITLLGSDSGADTKTRIEIIQYFETSYAGENNGLISSVLFTCCTVMKEPDPRVRAAAVKAVGACANLNNVMLVRRLVRVADPENEPVASVRSAALRTLAKCSNYLAAERVQLSARPNGEPDAEVRALASKLLQENPNLLR